MKKSYYNEEPQPFETVVSVGLMTTIIRFDIEETEDAGQGAWQCDESEFSHKESLTESDYGRLVSFLVREKFSEDAIEAISLNYMESKTTEHKNEFAELKAWRAQAKETARQIIGL